VTVELLGRAIRPGTARGVIAFDSATTQGRILAVEQVGPYLGAAGRGFQALLGGSAAPTASFGVPEGPPCVAGIDLELIRAGDVAGVDGSSGTVQLAGVRRVEVVTAFLQRDDGRVLLLRRSSKVGSFPGRWGGVSGFLETPSPEAQAIREVEEETGLRADALRLVRTAPAISVRDGDRMYLVHPFRFRVKAVEVRLDWEHTEAEWVDPAVLRQRPTVPRLGVVWDAVSDAPPTEGLPAAGKS
jgi:8-oxo-dGTP pyrophosphatase MutT (NUDIX family)